MSKLIIALIFSSASNALALLGPRLSIPPLLEESHADQTLIWYNALKKDDVKQYTDKLDNWLKPYTEYNEEDEKNRIDCDWDTQQEGKACRVSFTSKDFGPCLSKNNYSFLTGTPCVFLRLNNIENWTPSFFNRTTDELPQKMPRDLQTIIHMFDENNKKHEVIWVSCEGELPVDMENIGPIKFFPRRGFPGYFFPFKNQKGYMQPIIAVHFERPAVGILINIECKAWAHNIVHNRDTMEGSVRFQLLVDNF